MNEINAGCYRLTTTKKTTNGLKIDEYIVLISGYTPFLKMESIWSIKNNCFVSSDILRAVETKYEKIN
jgi:hypothetical protein